MKKGFSVYLKALPDEVEYTSISLRREVIVDRAQNFFGLLQRLHETKRVLLVLLQDGCTVCDSFILQDRCSDVGPRIPIKACHVQEQTLGWVERDIALFSGAVWRQHKALV